MNNLLTKVFISLSIILLFSLALNYKLGILDSVMAAAKPAKRTSDNKFIKNSFIQASQKPSKPTAIAQQTDMLSSARWWQNKVKSQVKATRNRVYSGCVFGDSISSGIGNTLGDRTFNFAIAGMSSVSLIEQLNILNAANVNCNKVIIAIGTNDAMYNIKNEQFIQNLKGSIVVAQAMGATKVVLIPAFYSTLEASYDPTIAGSIARVEEINTSIARVAETENVLISQEGMQSLFEGQALKKNVTNDGVHLNENGRKIYRQALLKILDYSCSHEC